MYSVLYFSLSLKLSLSVRQSAVTVQQETENLLNFKVVLFDSSVFFKLDMLAIYMQSI